MGLVLKARVATWCTILRGVVLTFTELIRLVRWDHCRLLPHSLSLSLFFFICVFLVSTTTFLCTFVLIHEEILCYPYQRRPRINFLGVTATLIPINFLCFNVFQKRERNQLFLNVALSVHKKKMFRTVNTQKIKLFNVIQKKSLSTTSTTTTHKKYINYTWLYYLGTSSSSYSYFLTQLIHRHTFINADLLNFCN